MKLSILIPAYNERYTVEQVVRAALAATLPAGVDREVVIVDDGSTDGTLTAIERLASEAQQVRTLAHKTRRGRGAALATAIEAASGDVCVFQDADLEYDPSEYSKLMQPILDGCADVVFGTRVGASGYRRALHFRQGLMLRRATAFSNWFTNIDLSDLTCGLKMARTMLLRSVPLRSAGFSLDAELAAKFAKRGFRVYEVPVSYRGRSVREGKKRRFADHVKLWLSVIRFAVVDDIYESRYGHDILHRLSAAHRFNRWMADTIRPWVGEHVLEIGSGMGNLAIQFLPRLQYTATDIDDLHLDYLHSRFGRDERISIERADVTKAEDFVALKDRFDTAICLNVIEHVKEDGAAVRNIFSALRSGGRACLLVPQLPALFGTLDEVLDHQRRYKPADFARLLKGAGFEIERQFSFNRPAVPAWWLNSVVLKKKNFGKVQLKIYDSLVWLWRVIDKVLPWPGISTIVIARKP